MKVYNYPEAKQVIVSGDIHGDFRTLAYKLCVQYGCTDTLLIVAGDCGFGFDRPAYYDQAYSRDTGRLRKANNWIVFIRGNHDDPSYFREEKVCYKRWRCVPDYSFICAAGHNILCVGGATSIDRRERIRENELHAGKEVAYYWPDEAPVYSREEILSIPVRLDTVVTHTAPSFCELGSHFGLSEWAKNDPGLLETVAAERQTLDAIHSDLVSLGHPISHWLYGHFHQSWFGQFGDIAFKMLDIMEFYNLPEITI